VSAFFFSRCRAPVESRTGGRASVSILRASQLHTIESEHDQGDFLPSPCRQQRGL
jgi:hypothetical protein